MVMISVGKLETPENKASPPGEGHVTSPPRHAAIRHLSDSSVGHIPTPARYLVSVGTPWKANPLGTSSVTAGVLPPGAAGGGEPLTLSLHATVHHEAHPCEPRGLSPGRGARTLPVRRPPGGDRAPSARLRSPRRLADAPHVRGSPSHVTPRASSAAARTRRRRSLAPACGPPGFLGVTSASSGRADRRCRLRTRFS